MNLFVKPAHKYTIFLLVHFWILFGINFTSIGQSKNVFYLKNGSIIYGNISKMNGNEISILSNDGSEIITSKRKIKKVFFNKNLHEPPYFENFADSGITDFPVIKSRFIYCVGYLLFPRHILNHYDNPKKTKSHYFSTSLGYNFKGKRSLSIELGYLSFASFLFQENIHYEGVFENPKTIISGKIPEQLFLLSFSTYFYFGQKRTTTYLHIGLGINKPSTDILKVIEDHDYSTKYTYGPDLLEFNYTGNKVKKIIVTPLMGLTAELGFGVKKQLKNNIAILIEPTIKFFLLRNKKYSNSQNMLKSYSGPEAPPLAYFGGWDYNEKFNNSLFLSGINIGVSF